MQNDTTIRIETVPPNARVDYDLMSDRVFDQFARDTVETCRRFFAIPGVQEKYEIWLKEYRKKQKERQTQ